MPRVDAEAATHGTRRDLECGAGGAADAPAPQWETLTASRSNRPALRLGAWNTTLLTLKGEGMEITTEELARFFASRRDFYRFLSRAYEIEPTDAYLDELAHAQLPVKLENEDFAHGCQLLVKAMRTRDVFSRGLIAVDYASLFIGVDGAQAPLPYESVQCDDSSMIMGESRDAVYKWYAGEGMRLGEDCKVPEDHLYLELQFMSIMAGRAADALQAGDWPRLDHLVGSMRGFLEEHLLRWAPTLCDQVAQLARTDFYRGIALMTKGFLTDEHDIYPYVQSQLAQRADEGAKEA